jgi:hypothetical protein
MSPLPTDTPNLPKWPFLVGDAVLIGLAFLIGSHARNPFAGTPLILIVASVALGAVLAAVPFVADYARKQDEALDERQRSLEALARTITASAEQISIAAGGLHGIAETAAKSLQLAEQLPARTPEKTGEPKSRLSEKETRELNALRSTESKHLETTADHIRQAAVELARLETVAQKNLAAVRAELDVKSGQILNQLDAKIAALADLVEKLSTLAPSLPAETTALFHTSPREEIGVSTGESFSVSSADTGTPAAAEEPKMPRKRPLKKPKVETLEPALGLEVETISPEPPAATAGTDEFSQPSPDEATLATSVSVDGATRLLVTAYIGIGNKLFLRGEGPGLSWDKGVPLQFVSIGKWRWETADATAPIHAKLYKNDEIECSAPGTLTVEPGQQAEVTAMF